MSNPQQGEPPPSFLYRGKLANWLSLHAFPLPELPSDIEEGMDPWFDRFTGKSSEQVRAVLQQDWRLLKASGLRTFAHNLSRYHPLGVLHSKHPDGDRNAWLVISRLPCDRIQADAISSGLDLAGIRYLAPPYQGPLPAEVDPNDVVVNFFLNFGGLRICPPFQEGSFYDVPMQPMEIEPGELDRLKGSDWEKASAVFVSQTGDELLLSQTRKLGWLLHDTREIEPFPGTFEEMLIRISTEDDLGPAWEY